MRKWPVVTTASIIVSLTVLMTSFPPLAASTARLVINGNGLNVVRLGTSESIAVKKLSILLGAPTTQLSPTPMLRNCGVNSMAKWHAFSLYFDHSRLVGMSLGPGNEPLGRTSVGLEVGSTLRRAKALYGKSLRVSTNQGGAWFVRTTSGHLNGFLSPSSGRSPTPDAKILTIDVGNVGCPAMSP